MHNEIMKKFLLATLPIFIFLIFPDTIWAKDYHFPKVEGRYQIQSDGSVEVLEHRTYSFDGSFSWADIYIPLKITRKGYSYDAQIADFMILLMEQQTATTTLWMKTPLNSLFLTFPQNSLLKFG